MAITLALINKIKYYRDMGMRTPQIAVELDLAVSTVRDTLQGKNGSEQRRIADRAEYFFGGIVDSGCYEARQLGSEDKKEHYTLTEYTDIVFEEVAFDELLDKMKEK